MPCVYQETDLLFISHFLFSFCHFVIFVSVVCVLEKPENSCSGKTTSAMVFMLQVTFSNLKLVIVKAYHCKKYRYFT